jgi:hypothetical protein
MENFSPKDLKARHAILYGIPGDISIDIDLWDGTDAVGPAYWNATTIGMWSLP